MSTEFLGDHCKECNKELWTHMCYTCVRCQETYCEDCFCEANCSNLKHFGQPEPVYIWLDRPEKKPKLTKILGLVTGALLILSIIRRIR
jgi:hypothetical protein